MNVKDSKSYETQPLQALPYAKTQQVQRPELDIDATQPSRKNQPSARRGSTLAFDAVHRPAQPQLKSTILKRPFQTGTILNVFLQPQQHAKLLVSAEQAL